jgi:hypothetical protein
VEGAWLRGGGVVEPYLTPIQAFFKGLGKDIQIRFA